MAYIRKTEDEWWIESNYGYGWDLETTESTLSDAKKQLKCYRENLNVPLRITRHRIKKED